MTEGRRVVVYHRYYGCMTGCCGHAVALVPDGEEIDTTYHDYSEFEKQGSFEFGHPYGEDHREYAEDILRQALGEEHVRDLDWEHSIVLDGESC